MAVTGVPRLARAGARTGARTGAEIRNWSRAAACTPQQVARPRSVDEVVALVRDAAARGLPVKAIGAGHSFTPAAMTDGVLVDVSALSGLRRVAGQRVTVGAGTHLHALPGLLAPYGLALENMGDIDRQTLAGATSTGTHGTGVRYRGLVGQITGVTLVTGTGDLLTVGEDDPLLPAVRLGVGALGIVVELQLRCVPAFLLHAVEKPARFAEVLDDWEGLARSHDHYEAYWWPHTDRMSTKANTRRPADTPYRPRGRFAALLTDEILGNGGGLAVATLGRWLPAATPRVNDVVGRWFADTEFTAPAHDVFVSPRRVRFTEMEYALPFAALPAAVRELRAVVERNRWRISFPVELRSAAADDTWLSTAHGRETSYVAVHRYWREDDRAYFAAAQDVFRAHDGRPHWGKLHTLGRAELAAAYPRFADFLAVRDRLDPAGDGGRRFANAYTRQLFGE